MPPSKSPFRIYDLSRYHQGWQWKVEFRHHGQGMKIPYFTEPDGRGVWVGKPNTKEAKQITPAEELTLPSHRQGVLALLCQYYIDREEKARAAEEAQKKGEKADVNQTAPLVPAG